MENAYPGQLNPLDFKQVPNRFWQGDEGREKAIKTVKHIIEQKCNIPIEEIPEKIDVAFFRRNELLGLFAIFDYSPYKVIRIESVRARRSTANGWIRINHLWNERFDRLEDYLYKVKTLDGIRKLH